MKARFKTEIVITIWTDANRRNHFKTVNRYIADILKWCLHTEKYFFSHTDDKWRIRWHLERRPTTKEPAIL